MTAHVTIDKRIPQRRRTRRRIGRRRGGAGVGGRSTTSRRASRLGADVAFCLVGGRARVRGIGEIVDPLPPIARDVTLVVPPLHVSTPDVYRAWDDLGGPTADGPNDLEPAALVVEPRLRHWRDRIGELCGVTPVLAGSGATWWVEGTRDDALADLVDEGATVIPSTQSRPAESQRERS